MVDVHSNVTEKKKRVAIVEKNSIILPKVNREDTPNHKFHVENEWKIYMFWTTGFCCIPNMFEQSFKKKAGFPLFFSIPRINSMQIRWTTKP